MPTNTELLTTPAEPETPTPGVTTTSAIATQAKTATPTPTEAARRLDQFKADVLIKRRSPILASPPKQKPPVKRSHIQTRSSRIAAQPLAHIPASKRGEVLLLKKMGVPPPPPQVTPASQRAYDAIRSGNLSESQIAVLDELFPAANYMAGRATRRPRLVTA
jgi:hypothetical protein